MTTSAELAALREVRDLGADVATLLRLARIFYEAGHDDALGVPASARKPPGRDRGNSCPSSESAQRPATRW